MATKKRTKKKVLATGTPTKPFNEVFYDVMWDCVRETNVYMNLQHMEKFRDSCHRAGTKLELEVMKIVAEGTRAIREDMSELTKLVKEVIESHTDDGK